MKKPILIYNPNVTSKTVLGSEDCWANRLLSFWLFRYACIILSCVSVLIFTYRYYAPSFRTNNSLAPVIPSWDFLLFTQSYPIGCCIWWETTSHRHGCNLRRDEQAWTIHGIWPTKGGTEGPHDCSEIPFNETALEPIKNELQERWPSIHYNDTGFWAHEWSKHGTCAIEDPIFNSEFTYFQLGLKWNQQWNMGNILKEAGITPSNTNSYPRSQFHDAIRKKLGKTAHLNCYYYKDLDIYIIQEISVCMAKDLTLLDCDEVYTVHKTCHSEEIFYPDALNLAESIKRKD